MEQFGKSGRTLVSRGSVRTILRRGEADAGHIHAAAGGLGELEDAREDFGLLFEGHRGEADDGAGVEFAIDAPCLSTN